VLASAALEKSVNPAVGVAMLLDSFDCMSQPHNGETLEGVLSSPIAFNDNKRQVLASLVPEGAAHEWWEFSLHVSSLSDLMVPEGLHTILRR
jgi:hypothetical protein